jgi:hypothetical protein
VGDVPEGGEIGGRVIGADTAFVIAVKRPKTNEIRAWMGAELAKYEVRWPIGTRQRTAYALMLYAGAARVDVHRMTWR